MSSSTSSTSSLKRALVARLLPRYAQGTLPAFLRVVVRDVLDDDADLATRYHLLRRLEHSALSDDRGVSAAQEELLFAGLQDALDRQASSSALTTSQGSWSQALGLPIWSSAAAAAAVVGFIVMASPGAGPDVDVDVDVGLGLQPRGDEHAPLGVRVRCVDAAGSRVLDDATAGARQKVSSLACSDDGMLAFSMTNLSETARHVFVVGVAADGQVVSLPPFSTGSQALRVEAGSVDVVVERLAPMPIVGVDGLTLHVLVDAEPFGADGIERRLQAASRSDLPLQSLDRLPVDVDVQARLNLYRRD